MQKILLCLTCLLSISLQLFSQSAVVSYYRTAGCMAVTESISTTQSYSFTHPRPSMVNNYDRLQQTDVNETSGNSAITMVSFETSEIAILNNPTSNKQIQIRSNSNQLLILLNNEGKQLLKIDLLEGINLIEAALLPAGLYHMRTEQCTEKVFIQ